MYNQFFLLVISFLIIKLVKPDDYQPEKNPKNNGGGQAGFDCSQHINRPVSQCNEVLRLQCDLFILQGGISCEKTNLYTNCATNSTSNLLPCETCKIYKALGGGRCYRYCDINVCKSYKWIISN
jgi:hypothetical protein